VSVGVFGLVAFVPAMALSVPEPAATRARERTDTWTYLRQNLLQAFRNPLLLALGIVEAAMYFGLRASKAFLPLYAVSVGMNPAQIGIIFSIQVAATLIAQPAGGHLSDRVGRKPVILLGLGLIAAALPLMVMTDSLPALVILSVALGLGEAAIMPSIITLGTELSDRDNYGSTLGMLDAMDNVGKALGPIAAGLLLTVFGYGATFALIAGLLVVAAILFFTLVRDLD
jgi:MFS family permease